MTQFSVLRECALNLSATMPETASADCMPLVNNSTENAGTSADVFLYLWSHLTCVLFGIQHQGKSTSVSKLVPSVQQSTGGEEEEVVVDAESNSGCSVDEVGGKDEPPSRVLESSCSSSSSFDVFGSSPKFGREVSPSSPSSGSEYHLSHIVGLCEEVVRSASNSSEFVRRELSSKFLLQSGDCPQSLAEDVEMSGTEMFETILRKLKKSIRMEETKKQGGPSSVVCCYSPLLSSTTRGTSEDETSTTTTTITHNNNIINNKIQHHRNVSIMAQMIKSQNQMRRNLKIQISVHQALFKQLAQLAEMDTLSTHPPAVPCAEDNTKLYYSQQMMAPAIPPAGGPSDAIPDLLTEVIRGDKHFGPYIFRAVKSIILLKASEQRLIRHIAKRQQHSYFHHHGIVDRTGSICSDHYRPFSKDACNSIPRTMPGYAYGPIAMRMSTAAVANTDLGGPRLPPPRQFSFPTEPHVSTEHTVHAMRCHPQQEPPSPLVDVAFTKRPITSKGAHATFAPFDYHQNPMYSGYADPGPVPLLGRVCSSYESHIPIPHPAYPMANAAYHRKPALTTREGLLTSDTAALDQMMVFDGGSPYVARETFPPGRASQRGLLGPSEQSFSSGSLTASEDSQPNDAKKSANQHPHKQSKHLDPQPVSRKEDGVTVHHDVEDEELMGIPVVVDGKRGSSSSSSHHPTKSKGFFGIQQLTKLWKGTKSSGSFFRWSAGIADNQHDTGGRGSQTLCAIDGNHHHHHHHLEDEDDSDFLSQRPSHFVSATGCEGVPPPRVMQHHHHHHASCGIIDNERLSSASTGYCRPTSVVMPTSRKPSKKNTTSHKHMRGASLCEVGTGGASAAMQTWQSKDHRNSLFSEDQPPQLVLQRKSETVVSRRHHHHHHKRKQQQRQRHDNVTTVCSSQSKAARARPIKENHAQCHITSTSSTSSSTEESASLQKAQLYFERIPMHFIKCGEDHHPPPQGVIPPHLLFDEPQASLDYDRGDQPPPQSPACLYQGYLFNATASASQYGNHLVSPQSWFKQDMISDDETAGSLYPQRSHLAQEHSGELNNLVIGSNGASQNWQSAAQFYPLSNDNSKPALLQPHYSDCVGRQQHQTNSNRHYRVYTGGDTTSGGFQRPMSPPTVKLMPSSDARHHQSNSHPSPYFPPTNKMGSTYLYRPNNGNSYHPPPPSHMENVNTKRVPPLTSRRKSVQQYEMNPSAGMFVYSPHPENLEYLNSPNQLIGNKSARCYSENRRSSFGSEDANRRDIAYCDMAAATERHTDKDIYLISGVSVCSNCPELEGRLTSMNESNEEIVTNRNTYHQQQQTYHHHPLSEDDQLQQAISRVRAKSGITTHRIIR